MSELLAITVMMFATACWRDSKPAASAEPAAPTPTEAATKPAGGFPVLDTACATDADCTMTSKWSNCCGVCEEKYANKAYVANVETYCAAHPPEQCPPMGCSWGMSPVGCVAGVCRESVPTPVKPSP